MALFVKQRRVEMVTSASLPNHHQAEDARVAMRSSIVEEKAFSIPVAWPEGQQAYTGCMYLTMMSLFLTVQDG